MMAALILFFILGLLCVLSHKSPIIRHKDGSACSTILKTEVNESVLVQSNEAAIRNYNEAKRIIAEKKCSIEGAKIKEVNHNAPRPPDPLPLGRPHPPYNSGTGACRAKTQKPQDLHIENIIIHM